MANLKLSKAELAIVSTVVTLVLSLCLGAMIWLGSQALSTGGLDLSQVSPLFLAEIQAQPDQTHSLPSEWPDPQSSDRRRVRSSESSTEPMDGSETPTAPLPSPIRSMMITFVTVFVAEMGDKTQLATMLMSAQSQSPWAIFLGSASALVTASLISVLLGEGLSQILPPSTLQFLAGAGFVVIGAYVLLMELWGPESEEEL